MSWKQFDADEVPSDPISRLRLRIKESERYVATESSASPISEEDKDALLTFSKNLNLKDEEYGDLRHEKLLRHCVIMAEQHGNLAACLEDEPAAEDMVDWVKQTYDNEETKRDYKVALRLFGKRVVDGKRDNIPEPLDWIKTTYKRNYDPTPHRDDLLDWDDDVEPMIDACYNARDKALVALCMDGGPRGGELKSLTVGNIVDHDKGQVMQVEGKTGKRDVLLIKSESYIVRWLSEHPARDDSSAPLWSKLNSADKISDAMLLKVLRKAAERADVTKDVTPTAFRKSSATMHAEMGIPQPALERRYGWVSNSKAAMRYINIANEASKNEVAKAYGIEVEEDTQPMKPVTCDRCGNTYPQSEPACVWCGKAKDASSVQHLEDKAEEVRDMALKFVADNPDLHGEIKDANDLLKVMDQHPEIEDDVREFMLALEDDSNEEPA